MSRTEAIVVEPAARAERSVEMLTELRGAVGANVKLKR